MAANAPGIISRITGSIGAALRDAKWAILLAWIGLEGQDAVRQVLTTGKYEFDVVPEFIADALSPTVAEAERIIGQPLFELLIRAPSGANLSREAGHEEAIAVGMLERMFGFAVGLPFAVARVKSLLIGLMGENAATPLVEAVEKIPEETGINWALGMTMSRIMDIATARPIEEAIAEQTRPQRLEWPQIRALARQHEISLDDLRERLRKAGWRDQDIPLLEAIDRQPLTVGDLQQAFIFGLRSEQWVSDHLEQIGLDGEARDLVMDLYVKRAETAGGDQLRAVAQKGYLDGHLSRDQYVGILQSVNVPDPSIAAEVRAADLVKEWGRTSLSVAEVKKLHSDGIIDDRQAEDRLLEHGYTEPDALSLIQDWNIDKRVAHSGINENRILSYLMGGVLTPVQAYDRLIGEGIKPVDATFLVAHPDAARVVQSRPASESTILAAMEDGILNQPEAEAALVAFGLSADAAHLTVMVRLHRMNRGPRTRQAPKTLSESQVLEAVNLGLATETWAVRELVSGGYGEMDAMLLVAEQQTKANKAIPDGWVVLS